MALDVRRIILFTPNLAAMTAFYRDVLGLELAGREEGWVDFRAGACAIALHQGRAEPGRRPPKIVFYAADVAAARATLVRNGLKGAGPVKSTGDFDLCDARDPDGNPFQISSRR